MAVIKKLVIIKFMQQFKNVKSKLIKNITDYISRIENGGWTLEDVKKIEVMFLELKTLPRDEKDADEWLSFYLQLKRLEIRFISAIPFLIGLG